MPPTPQPQPSGWIRPPSQAVPRSRHRRNTLARGDGLVLVVDDSADAREIYADSLRHSGFAVVTASDGELGIHAAVAHRPDVIVMDLSMPRLDGLDATRFLKQHRRTRRIPVIMLTGYPFEAIDKNVLEAGVDVFLTKPCLPEELERRIRQLCSTRARLR
jgi:two-component system cell cycle response regulator DivK